MSVKYVISLERKRNRENIKEQQLELLHEAIGCPIPLCGSQREKRIEKNNVQLQKTTCKYFIEIWIETECSYSWCLGVVPSIS